MKKVLNLFVIKMIIMACPCMIQFVIAAPKPQTIPAVQEWNSGTGTCTYSTTSRIVLNSSDAALLADDGQTFCCDLSGLLAWTQTLLVASTPKAGDIFISLGATDTTIGNEGYLITIDQSIQIRARTGAGAFYGTRTLLQLLKQSTTLNQGTIRDWPKGKWRGMMVDVGRKFFTASWIKTRLRDMAYQKMNLFHWHLSDAISKTNNGGFRLESSRHPEITSTEHYSNAELQEIIGIATKYHITIIPEFDFPGHCSWLYASHKNLLLNTQVLGSQYWALDLSLDTTYAFVKEILDEFVPKFPGPFWHLGADEYMFPDEFDLFPQLTTEAKNKYGTNAHAIDCYRDFVNFANGIIKSKGKTMWAWGGDIVLGITGTKIGVCTLATDIFVDHWSNYSGTWGGGFPQAIVNRGHNIMNCRWDIYYIISSGSPTPQPTKTVYDTYEFNSFDQNNILPATDPHILGIKFPIWADVPNAQTEDQVATGIFMLSRTIAQKGWASQKVITDYTAFTTFANNTIGQAPIPGQCNSTEISIPVEIQTAKQEYEIVQIFNLRGALILTVSGKDFKAAQNSAAHLKIIGIEKELKPGPLLCRFIGRGFERSAVVMMVR